MDPDDHALVHDSSGSIALIVFHSSVCATSLVRERAPSAAIDSHDGAHDFNFLIGNWKAHVRRLPDRLNGSDTWGIYDGMSNHKKLLGSNANFEESEVDSPTKHLHTKAQTLRLCNPHLISGASTYLI
jgi:hypothetical protein